MTTYTFGTDVDPAHYVEIPDPDNAGQVIRPDAGEVVKVRDAVLLTALPDTASLTYGYLSFSTTDVPLVQVSGDGGSTWIGPLIAIEAQAAAATGGTDLTALQQQVNVQNSEISAIQAALGGLNTPVASVAGRTGAVVLTPADVSLASVNNTADLAKPLSTATVAALALKQKQIRVYADATAANVGLLAGDFADGDLVITQA